ncbi:MAG: SAM-dependent methyltransferase [Burkholderiaceae bacterium]
MNPDQPTNTASAKKGRLLLVPTPLDFGCADKAPLASVLPQATITSAAALHYWICENARTTRAFLKRVDAICPLAMPLQALQMQELPREVHKKGDHLGGFDARPMLAAALAGHDVGLISEAGMPAIADPGSSVVRAAHALGLVVLPLIGPVSLLLTLAASGLNGQNFAFVGYLPQDPQGRAKRIRTLEALALSSGQTQLFIETPYRNAAMVQSLLRTLTPSTQLAIGSGLTLPSARVQCLAVSDWPARGSPPDNATPAVYAIGR